MSRCDRSREPLVGLRGGLDGGLHVDASIPFGQASLSLAVREGRPVLQLAAERSATGAQPQSSMTRLAELPPVEILAVGHGRRPAGVRHVETSIGARLELLE